MLSAFHTAPRFLPGPSRKSSAKVSQFANGRANYDRGMTPKGAPSVSSLFSSGKVYRDSWLAPHCRSSPGSDTLKLQDTRGNTVP